MICNVVFSNAHAKYLRNSIGRSEQVLNIHSFFKYTGDICRKKNTVQKQEYLCINNKSFNILTYPFYTVIFWSVVKRYLKWCGYIPQYCIGNTIHLPNVSCVNLLYTVVHLLHSSRWVREHLYSVHSRTISVSTGPLSIWAGLRGCLNTDTDREKSCSGRVKENDKVYCLLHGCW